MLVETKIIVADLHRRRSESRRLEPVECRCHDRHTDPSDCQVDELGGPTDFGLTPAELVAEIKRCDAEGWSRWELLARFTSPLDRQAA
jgi:hypothetical protein